jgi:hypothetical protein
MYVHGQYLWTRIYGNMSMFLIYGQVFMVTYRWSHIYAINLYAYGLTT